MGVRVAAAVLAGRAVRVAARLRGGGSAIPGRTALALYPRFLEHAIRAIPGGVIAVSGSNGKSTTTNMLAAILREHGLRVFTNPSGGNLPQGIASAVLADADLQGRIEADIAVLEVDEGYGRRLADVLQPRIVLLLNIQIDQLNRYHEPERVVAMLADVAASATRAVVLNADDNHLVDLDARLPDRADREVSRFGVTSELLARSAHGSLSADRFDAGPALPAIPDVVVVAQDDAQATLRADGVDFDVRLPTRGLHYAVDAAGAAAAARAALGSAFDPALVTQALAGLETVYGRGELLVVDGEEVEMIMMKNPASLQLNLDALERTPDQVLMALDEGTPDPSWLYDMDLDALDHVDVITGSKAHQLALRMAYSDIPVGSVAPDLTTAVKAFLRLPRPSVGRKLMIVNYEQMMLIRSALGLTDLEGGRRA